MRPTLAVFGGSFDPPHVGHTLVCAYVLTSHAIDGVLVVPAAQHAFDKPLTDFEHRHAMCRLAMRDLAHVEVSTIERDRPGPSLTLHTLEQLHTMLESNKLQETPPGEMSEMAKIVLEAGRVATEKMLDYYRRMGIEVTPEMTLAPEKPMGVQPTAR